MSRDKYSVLLMRDDTRVKRFRFSPVWLKLTIYFLLLLSAAAAAGTYAGYTYWSKNKDLAGKRQALEKELRETRLNLERLQNVEKILQSNDPEELQSLFGSINIQAPASEQTPPPPPPPTVNLSKVFKHMDLGEVRLDNISVKDMEDGNQQLSFDLNNANTNKALAGHVKLVLVTNEGKSHAVNARKADLMFQIQRYKKIVTTYPIPEGLARDNLFGLRMTIITTDGEIIFSDTFQMERILEI